MSNKIWNQIICLGVMVLLLSSCKKNLLDQAPQLDLNLEKIFSDVSRAEQFVNNIYAALPNGFTPPIHESNAMESVTTDEADQSYQWTKTEQFQKGSWGSFTDHIASEWSRNYSAIRKTNMALENLPNALDNRPTDDLTVERLQGEVLFLRAFFYFDLAKKFGGVPIVTKVLSPYDDLSGDNIRKSFKETIEQIVKDCEAAAPLLPQTYTPPPPALSNTGNTGRVTQGACLALKAKALLYLASPLNNPSNDVALWQNAANAAKAVIDMNLYKMFANYQETFTKTNNSEIIFSRQARGANNWEIRNSPCGPRIGGWGGTCPTQDLVDKYDMKTTGLPITHPLSGYNPAKPYDNRDPRFYASILYNDANWAGFRLQLYPGGAETQSSTDYSRTGYFMKKFMWEGTVRSGYRNNAFHNWTYLRLGEVYLNYAEALNEASGPTPEVYAAVNEVRKRAGMPNFAPGLTKEQMRERLRNERAVELCFEEHRFWDVRRWKIAESTLGVPIHGMAISGTGPDWTYAPFVVENRVFLSKMYLFPIPQNEINKNKGLVQSEGWE